MTVANDSGGGEGSQSQHRISLSEERLKFALSELEWRLKVYFDDKLRTKADNSSLITLTKQVDALDRGDFTEVHKRALRDFIGVTLAASGDSKWTARQRLISLVAISVALCSFILTALLALGGVG